MGWRFKIGFYFLLSLITKGTSAELRPWLSHLQKVQEVAIVADSPPGQSLREYLHLYFKRFQMGINVICPIQTHTDSGYLYPLVSHTICGVLTLKGSSRRNSNSSRLIFKLSTPSSLHINASLLSLTENFEDPMYIGCGFNDVELKAENAVIRTLCGKTTQESFFIPSDTIEIHTYNIPTEALQNDSSLFSLSMQFQGTGKIQVKSSFLLDVQFLGYRFTPPVRSVLPHHIDGFETVSMNYRILKVKDGLKMVWTNTIYYQPGMSFRNFEMRILTFLPSMYNKDPGSCSRDFLAPILDATSRFMRDKCLTGVMKIARNALRNNQLVLPAISCQGFLSPLYNSKCPAVQIHEQLPAAAKGYIGNGRCGTSENIPEIWKNIFQILYQVPMKLNKIPFLCNYDSDPRDSEDSPIHINAAASTTAVLLGKNNLEAFTFRIWSLSVLMHDRYKLSLRRLNVYLPQQDCANRDMDIISIFDGPYAGIVTTQGLVSPLAKLFSGSCVTMSRRHISGSIGSLTMTWSNRQTDKVTLLFIFYSSSLGCPGKSCFLQTIPVFNSDRIVFNPAHKPAVHLFHFTQTVSHRGMVVKIEVQQMIFSYGTDGCPVSGLYLFELETRPERNRLMAGFCTPEGIAMLKRVMERGLHLTGSLLIAIKTYPKTDFLQFAITYHIIDCPGRVNPDFNDNHYRSQIYSSTLPCSRRLATGQTVSDKFTLARCCFKIYHILSDIPQKLRDYNIDVKALLTIHVVELNLDQKSVCCEFSLIMKGRLDDYNTPKCHYPSGNHTGTAATISFPETFLRNGKKDKCSHEIRFSWTKIGSVSCVITDKPTMPESTSLLQYYMTTCGLMTLTSLRSLVINFHATQKDHVYGFDTIFHLLSAATDHGPTSSPTTLSVTNERTHDSYIYSCFWHITLYFDKPSVFYFKERQFSVFPDVGIITDSNYAQYKKQSIFTVSIGAPELNMTFSYSALQHEIEPGIQEISSESCKEGGVPFLTRCHALLDKEDMSWEDARNACNSRGWDLLSINSETEWDAILKFLQARHARCMDHRTIYLGLMNDDSVSNIMQAAK